MKNWSTELTPLPRKKCIFKEALLFYDVGTDLDDYLCLRISLTQSAYEGQGFEIAGFGWHPGWNDRINQRFNDEYQRNVVNLINDLGEAFSIPRLPFVLATTGMSGRDETHPRALSPMNAQLAAPNDSRLLQEGNVAAIDTRDFWRPIEDSPANQNYHWNRNAETYLLIGKGLAESMQQLICTDEWHLISQAKLAGFFFLEMGALSLKGISKNNDFFVVTRKHRAENRSLHGVNEDLSTELTPLPRKKCIFRDALNNCIHVSARPQATCLLDLSLKNRVVYG